ncbi:MAG: dihydroorotate dehydrogenase-like protein [Bacteroidetes bacterium]|nr:dihydroorotate dehydrogenase-like protein [Bacteroidota bacterium]
MIDLSTQYMGLTLKNPIIVGSSGLTASVENVIEIEKNGAGAVVLKSLFEEQIKNEINKTTQSGGSSFAYPEALAHIKNYTELHSFESYLDLIVKCKKAVKIPVIASINCITASEWIVYARKIEEAGADALELNIFLLPSDLNHSSEENEKVYFDIINDIKKQVKIPIAVKTSFYFSGLAKMMLKLSWTGISSLVFFNRFFSPDIDIDNFLITSANVYSHPEEISTSLRWVAVLSDKLYCDVAASTGIHDGKAVIKQLLAGAKATQIVSVLYLKGFEHIPVMLKDVEAWMQKHDFKSIEAFRGKMSYKKTGNTPAFLRVQFMQYFGEIE